MQVKDGVQADFVEFCWILAGEKRNAAMQMH